MFKRKILILNIFEVFLFIYKSKSQYCNKFIKWLSVIFGFLDDGVIKEIISLLDAVIITGGNFDIASSFYNHICFFNRQFTKSTKN